MPSKPGIPLRPLPAWYRADVGRRTRSAMLIAALFVAGGCATPDPRFVVRGEIHGFPFQGTTDSEQSQALLQRMLGESGRVPAAGVRSIRLDQGEPAGPPDREALQQLTRQHSQDLAALVFAQQVLSLGPNRRVQLLYLKNLARIQADPEAVGREVSRAAAGYSFVFAPAWLYRSRPWNGADFRRPRQLLEANGIQTELLDLAEDGAVEDSAARIAAALREPAAPGRKRILVSTSKSGGEVALAVGGLLAPEELASVAAWINIGGLLQGTPLVDIGLNSWRKPLVQFWFALQGWNWAGVESMATPIRRARFATLRFPAHLLVVNFVGVPLSGDMTFYSRAGYALLERFGPNDGVALLADQIVPEGVTILQPGADHYFDLPDIDLRGMALVKSVLDLVATGTRRPETAEAEGTPAFHLAPGAPGGRQ